MCVTRRHFIKIAVGASTGGLYSNAIGQKPFSSPIGANGDIRIAQVGLGSIIGRGGRPSGKGQKDINHWRKIPGVRVVAICDPCQEFLEREAGKFRLRNEPIDTYTDIRDLLENSNIDAIGVTTPDHWHALATIWACQAGKDVFVQKPASHNIFEGRKMVEAAEKYGRIVQSAANTRSQTGVGETFDYIRSGNLGEIQYVRGVYYRNRPSIGQVTRSTPIPKELDYDLWSGPAEVAPVERRHLHYDWHWDWRYGTGDIGNGGLHRLDACRWALGIDSLPEHALSIGGRFGEPDDGETPNTQIGFLDYRPAPIIFEVRGLPRNRTLRKGDFVKSDMDTYLGKRNMVIVKCEGGYTSDNQVFDENGKLIKTLEPTNDNLFVNFIKAMKSRRTEDLRTDMLQGHLSASLAHMVNISNRVGQDASIGEVREIVEGETQLSETFNRMLTHLDANEIDLKKTPLTLGPWLTINPKTERFEGAFSERANALAVGKYREPFVVPDVV